MPKYVLLIAIVALAVSRSNQVQAEDAPLNFVVVLVDDMGWMDLLCQGSDYFRTPNIDRLAKEGMRFTDEKGIPMKAASGFRFSCAGRAS